MIVESNFLTHNDEHQEQPLSAASSTHSSENVKSNSTIGAQTDEVVMSGLIVDANMIFDGVESQREPHECDLQQDSPSGGVTRNKRSRSRSQRDGQKSGEREIGQGKESGNKGVTGRKPKTGVPKKRRKKDWDDSSSLSSSASSGESNEEPPRRQIPARIKRKSPNRGKADAPNPDVAARPAKRRKTAAVNATRTPPIGSPFVATSVPEGDGCHFPHSQPSRPAFGPNVSPCPETPLTAPDDSVNTLSAPSLIVATALLELHIRRQQALEAYLDASERLFFPVLSGGFDELFYIWTAAAPRFVELPQYCDRFSEEERQFRLEKLINRGDAQRLKFAKAAENHQDCKEQLTYPYLFEGVSTQEVSKDILSNNDVPTEPNNNELCQNYNVLPDNADGERIPKKNEIKIQEPKSEETGWAEPPDINPTLPFKPDPSNPVLKKKKRHPNTFGKPETNGATNCNDINFNDEWLNGWIVKDKKAIAQKSAQAKSSASKAKPQLFSWLDFLRSPVVHSPSVVNWTPREIALFEVSLCTYGQDFAMISRCVETKTFKEAYDFYTEIFKQTNRYQAFKEHKNYGKSYVIE